MVDTHSAVCYNMSAMDQRILKVEKCPCGGPITFCEDTGEFKCLTCGQPYQPSQGGPLEKAQKKYWKSPKGKEVQIRYRDSEKGQEATQRSEQSVKGKLTKRRYYYSKKGQAAHQRRNEKVARFKELSRFLEDNPGKTPQDFIPSPDA